MSSSSPPDDKAIALRRSMTLHHRDVQQNCSLESDIKRNQCHMREVNALTKAWRHWTRHSRWRIELGSVSTSPSSIGCKDNYCSLVPWTIILQPRLGFITLLIS